jgi:hypothetical protein
LLGWLQSIHNYYTTRRRHAKKSVCLLTRFNGFASSSVFLFHLSAEILLLQRIDRIQSTLSSDLDHLFASTLVTVTGEGKLSEVEKAKLNADLTECLRTYDVLGLWRDAEDVLRREVVRGFIKRVRLQLSYTFHIFTMMR